MGQTLLRIHWSVYFDDYVVVASAEEKCHLDLVLRSYFALIGWETSDEKDAGFSSVAKALGVEICLDDIRMGLLKVQNTESRKRELAATIETIDANGGAHTKEFECLRGRLQFAESQVFGRGAAQRMRVVSKAMKLSGFVVLDDPLTEALLFLKDRVLHGGARLLKACDRAAYHLFADASFIVIGACSLDGSPSALTPTFLKPSTWRASKALSMSLRLVQQCKASCSFVAP